MSCKIGDRQDRHAFRMCFFASIRRCSCKADRARTVAVLSEALFSSRQEDEAVSLVDLITNALCNGEGGGRMLTCAGDSRCSHEENTFGVYDELACQVNSLGMVLVVHVDRI